jgi:BirA family transcriptional regulator, biotin operon repressor / biotin---[acetyl-CoA-carboxylase] ligase
MQGNELSAALADLPLGGLRFFQTIGSTNDSALQWAAGGAPDLSLVVADEQTAGRGRAGRHWQTPPGAALALSLVLRPSAAEAAFPGRLAGLAALALVDCCKALGLHPQVKWPNDVLLAGRKTAGILVETSWGGSRLDAAILGIGVNVAPASVPTAPSLSFPATCLETELGAPLGRPRLLRDILAAMLAWRPRLASDDFLHAWEASLAYRGTAVSVGRDGGQPLAGTLLGLEPDGSLRLMANSKTVIVHVGEIHMRPADDKMV